MSQRTVANLDDDVAGLLQATDLDNVTNKNGAYQRALMSVKQRVYIPEASGRQSIMLYDKVYNYPAPSTIFGGSLNDIRPQGVTRIPSDYAYKLPIEMFDRTKGCLPNGYQVTFEFDTLLNPIMRIAQHKTKASILIDPMNSITGWAAGGVASTPVLDSTVFYQSPASLRFSLSGVGAGYIEKTLSNSIDMTTYKGVGVNFLALFIPTVANLTSVELRLGSDSSNYYVLTVTKAFLGAWQNNSFDLSAFDLSQATTVLSPDITKIKYIRATFNVTGAITNIRAGQLFSALPSPHEILFGSTAVFRNASTFALSSTISSPNDQLMLADPIYNIYQHECAYTIALQNGGQFAGGLISSIYQTLHGSYARNGKVMSLGLYELYSAANPSEELRSTGNWYDD